MLGAAARPQRAGACAGPRSELGEAAAAADDVRSFFDVAESDLASSEGAPSVPVRKSDVFEYACDF